VQFDNKKKHYCGSFHTIAKALIVAGHKILHSKWAQEGRLSSRENTRIFLIFCKQFFFANFEFIFAIKDP